MGKRPCSRLWTLNFVRGTRCRLVSVQSARALVIVGIVARHVREALKLEGRRTRRPRT